MSSEHDQCGRKPEGERTGICYPNRKELIEDLTNDLDSMATRLVAYRILNKESAARKCRCLADFGMIILHVWQSTGANELAENVACEDEMSGKTQHSQIDYYKSYQRNQTIRACSVLA